MLEWLHFLLASPLILNYHNDSLFLIVIAALHFLSVSKQIDIESTSIKLSFFLLPCLALLILHSCYTLTRGTLGRSAPFNWETWLNGCLYFSVYSCVCVCKRKTKGEQKELTTRCSIVVMELTASIFSSISKQSSSVAVKVKYFSWHKDTVHTSTHTSWAHMKQGKHEHTASCNYVRRRKLRSYWEIKSNNPSLHLLRLSHTLSLPQSEAAWSVEIKQLLLNLWVAQAYKEGN